MRVRAWVGLTNTPQLGAQEKRRAPLNTPSQSPFGFASSTPTSTAFSLWGGRHQGDKHTRAQSTMKPGGERSARGAHTHRRNADVAHGALLPAQHDDEVAEGEGGRGRCHRFGVPLEDFFTSPADAFL